MTPASDDRSRRRPLILLGLLVVMGSCGVAKGAQNVASGPPGADFVAPAEDAEMAEVQEELARFAPPLRRPLAAANVVVSVLLLVAAWAVATGRSTRTWWVTQAALANSVWTGLDGGAQLFALLDARERLAPLLERALQTPEGGPSPPPWLQDGSTVIYMGAVLVVLHALVRLGLYGLAIWLARRT
ncbi:MAG: hypothetical protein ACODAU_00860 [Myxococcota bacterium]